MTFSRVCYQALPPPRFFWESGNEAMRNPSRYMVHAGATVYTQWMVKPSGSFFCFMQNLLSGYNKVSIKWPVDSLLRLLSDFSITQPWQCLLITVIKISGCANVLAACEIFHNLTNCFIHYDFDSLPEVYLVKYIIDGFTWCNTFKNTKTHQRTQLPCWITMRCDETLRMLLESGEIPLLWKLK